MKLIDKDKQLLLVDLCGRLPYGVRVQYENKIYNIDYISALYEEVKLDTLDNYTISLSEIKPYLRPMSSMTDEERKEYAKLLFADLGGVYEDYYKALDYLHSIHVDYRGLIPKGLALEVTEENNPYK